MSLPLPLPLPLPLLRVLLLQLWLLQGRDGGGGRLRAGYFAGQKTAGYKKRHPLKSPIPNCLTHTLTCSPCSVQSHKDLQIKWPLKAALVHNIRKNLQFQKPAPKLWTHSV